MTISIYGTGSIATENTSLSLTGTSLVVPVGNTLSRPSSPVPGMLRFNNQSNLFELYNGVFWANVSNTPTSLPDSFKLEYLVVAGGGAGGSNQNSYGGGGGGGGGVLKGNITITPPRSSDYIITTIVGAGGPGVLGVNSPNGSNSILITNGLELVAVGGGAGGALDGGGTNINGQNGGSGGGGGNHGGSKTWYGTGISGQGFQGGYQEGIVPSPNASSGSSGGGGGGAGGAAANINGIGGGVGGNGYTWINGVTYAGGGGGGPSGAGGPGGGASANNTILLPRNASVNTGGGGGAGASFTGGSGSGGSGIILLMHSNTISNAIVSAGLVCTVNTQISPGNIMYSITSGAGTLSWR